MSAAVEWSNPSNIACAGAADEWDRHCAACGLQPPRSAQEQGGKYRFVQYTFAMRWMAPPAEEILDVFDKPLFCSTVV
jgi:hypothetical protein